MEVKVQLNNLRVAPRKARQVVDLVRNKNVAQARSVLEFTINKSAQSVLKLLNSAVASALHDLKLEESNLFVSKITVDEGPKLKRWHPMSRGRAYPIIKRTCHIVLVLSEKNPTVLTKKEVAIKEAEVKEVPAKKKTVTKSKKSITKKKA